MEGFINKKYVKLHSSDTPFFKGGSEFLEGQSEKF